MDGVNAPFGVGPHEGLELALLNSDKKDVALFLEVCPTWVRYCERFGLRKIKFQVPFRGIGSYPCWIVFKRKSAADAMRLKRLVLRAPRKFDARHERLVGDILGYSRLEIDAFIEHVQKK